MQKSRVINLNLAYSLNFLRENFHPTLLIGRLFAYSLNYFLEKCHPTRLWAYSLNGQERVLPYKMVSYL